MPLVPVRDSAVIYCNAEDTIFLIDTPLSIALAQNLSRYESTREEVQPVISSDDPTAVPQERSRTKRRLLRSTRPLERPFPSTEPKSLAARKKLLEKVPFSEQRYHDEFIQPLVRSALEMISAGHGGQEHPWCLPRVLCDDPRTRESSKSPSEGLQPVKKRPRGSSSGLSSGPMQSSKCNSFGSIPPLILSSTSDNIFHSLNELSECVVKNVFAEPATIVIESPSDGLGPNEFIIPPRADFTMCTLPLSPAESSGQYSRIKSLDQPIPTIPSSHKFNVLLFDPPWPNRSVRRSGHYQIHPYSEMAILTQRLRDILRVHSYHADAKLNHPDTTTLTRSSLSQSRLSVAGIWITNAEKARRAAYEALITSGFRITEEWIWIKTTADGQPICPIDGLWRKPYEILVVGRADPTGSAISAEERHDTWTKSNDLLGVDPGSIRRRVIAAVPDLHSRKPSLKELFERIFFMEKEGGLRVQSYSAMEIFARNLTAGWLACGNEVLKFNARECWAEAPAVEDA
ncbi:hypothetical protein POX_d05858 [Penicillium oxalicum]|uniref:MT-A70 family n=1 Tax=Penicillium oxalicum (strain 114-2 / CGMCC 5302) TaxID=933388 RepID=S8BAV5_PENO1|nr:hypothetical protein POX_d05858 [Penicillium oxalicum]EPS31962.1 hypothetical protein PDE_06921 [Penicillium oxalicum 114-2]KAI2790348.1 hypothetical protein POX_d05858 [Penicillium oxalicum]